MITEIPINESHIFAFKVTEKLEADDYKYFRPKLEKLLEKESPLSLLIKLEDFEGWTAKAAWEDMKIGFKHRNDFLRIAIVGSSTWEKLMAGFGDLFTDIEVQYFDDASNALEWLHQVKNHAEEDEYVGYRHILVATDFSDYGLAALKKGLEIAKPFNAEVTLMHAVETLSTDMYPGIGELTVPVLVNNPELERKQFDRIDKKLEKILTKMDIPKDQVKTVVVEGHPVDTILEYAIKHDNDLIVMGSHGRRGLARLLGSSTNGVINHAPCDVLTVIDND